MIWVKKELGADPKAIQQIEFLEQLKKLDVDDKGTDAGDNYQFMFVLAIIEKIKETRLNIFSRKYNSIIKDGKVSRSKS